jgi:hypothetical protein
MTINPIVTTRDVPVARPARLRMSTRSISAPMSGANTHTTMKIASGAGHPWLKRNSQYTNAMNIPMPPWAKLKIPDVVYVRTSPLAATA